MIYLHSDCCGKKGTQIRILKRKRNRRRRKKKEGDGEGRAGQEEKDRVKERDGKKGKVGRGERGGTIFATSKKGTGGKNKENVYPSGSRDQVSLKPKHIQDLLEEFPAHLGKKGLLILK